MKAHGGVAHLALDLCAGHKGGDGVHDDAVDGAGAHEHIAYFQGLLAGIGLGDEHLVDVDADAGRIDRIEGMLGVDESHDAAEGLGLGEDLEGQSGLAAGLRAVDLDDAAPGHTADAEGGIEGQRAGGYDPDVEVGAPLAEGHDGPLAELRLDLIGGELEHLLFILVHGVSLSGPSYEQVADFLLLYEQTYACQGVISADFGKSRPIWCPILSGVSRTFVATGSYLTPSAHRRAVSRNLPRIAVASRESRPQTVAAFPQWHRGPRAPGRLVLEGLSES